MSKSECTPNVATDSEQYQNFVRLMSVYAEAETRMGALSNESQAAFIEFVDERREEYAKLQQVMLDAHEAIEEIARTNRKWFASGKTLKTPFGSVSFRSSTSLDVKNEELTIHLIQDQIEKELAEGDSETKPASAAHLRTRVELDLESLERLTDAELAKFRIKRVPTESFKIKAVAVDLGAAVDTAAKGAKGGK